MSTLITSPHDGFSDDRLLAFALDLGDDAELVAAIKSSPLLEQRLALIRDEVSIVCDRLQTAVPMAGPDYADPAAARWQRLQAFYMPATVSSGRRGPRRIGRLASIAAALAIFAVAVGVAVQQLPGGKSADTATESTRSVGGAVPAGAPADKGTGGLSYDGNTIALPQAEHFKTVVVARAGAVVQDLQSFAVLRVLKGRIADRISLVLRGGAAALPTGSLDVLYLRPLYGYHWAAEPDQLGAGGSATPTPAGANVAIMPMPASGYAMSGQDAYVQPVPDGVDISTLTAP
jgi:hypothetical protein